MPFGLDYPYWVDDAEFDLDFHVRELALSPPGNEQKLAEQVARIVARPLDRARPLWEVYCAGARLEAHYPVSVITDGMGLNITVMSYCGKLDSASWPTATRCRTSGA